MSIKPATLQSWEIRSTVRRSQFSLILRYTSCGMHLKSESFLVTEFGKKLILWGRSRHLRLHDPTNFITLFSRVSLSISRYKIPFSAHTSSLKDKTYCLGYVEPTEARCQSFHLDEKSNHVKSLETHSNNVHNPKTNRNFIPISVCSRSKVGCSNQISSLHHRTLASNNPKSTTPFFPTPQR